MLLSPCYCKVKDVKILRAGLQNQINIKIRFMKKSLLFGLILAFGPCPQSFAQTEVFNETFDVLESMAQFSVIDANDDGEYWKYFTINESVRCATGMNSHDDWMVTPAIEAKAGYTYRLTFTACADLGSLEIGVATEATDAALSANIIYPETSFTTSYEAVQIEYVSATSGPCYFGFHAVGGGFWSYVDVDNIVITEVAPAEPATVLYGTIVTDSDNSYTAGIYSFEPGEQMELTPVVTRTDCVANGGGVYVDEKYHFTLFMMMDVSTVFAAYNVYDFETGQIQSVMHEGLSYIASDMAYDPTTGNVYCCSVGATPTDYVLSTMDLATGEKTAIAPIEMMVAIAADREGRIYGISDGGILYLIDKTDGSLAEVGDTGFRGLGQMIQSATIDPETGEFWWAMANASESGLYKVDTQTGQAELVGRFPNGEHMAGLFVRKPFFDGQAPDAVENLEVAFEGTSLSGIVRFTAPSLNCDGTSLDSSIDFTLMIDNEQYAVRQGVEPGSAVEIPVEVADGMHEFVVVPHNEAGGQGKPSNCRRFVGSDTPMNVSDVRLVNEGSQMHVTWTAPAGGVNGGYVDAAEVTYDIQRYPDYEWVATDLQGTSFTDELESTAMRTYSYGVVAKYNGKESEMIVSNFVTVGDELELPIMETFEIPQTFETWDIIDANADGYTWGYSTEIRAAIYLWSVTAPQADDWLVSPRFRLEAGKEYELGIDARNTIPGELEKVEVYIGTDATVEGMTRCVIPLAEINDDTQWTHLKQTFAEEAGGTYRIGIRVSSDTHIGDLLVRNVSLKEVENGRAAVETADKALLVSTESGILTVDNRTESTAVIYAVDGRACGTVAGGAVRQFDVVPGVYIVTDGVTTEKVLVGK